MKHSTVLLVIGFVLLWNSGFIGAEYGLPYTGPFSLLFWRYAALTLIILAYLKFRKRMRWVGWPTASFHMFVGILAHGVWLSCVLLALHRGVPAGIVALVVALQPMATGALSGVVAGEPTPLHQWAGLLVGFAGVAMTVITRIDFNDTASVFGYLIPFGSAISMTTASLIQRKMEITQNDRKLPLDLTLFYQCIATTFVLVFPALFFEKLVTQWTPEFLWTMAWLIIGVSLSAYALMWLLLVRIDATRVASLFYLGPPVTMMMAWIAFGDTLQMMDVIGVIVVCLGVLLTQLPSKGILNKKI